MIKQLSNTHLQIMREDFPSMQLQGNHETWVLMCPLHFDRRERKQFFVDVRNDKYHCLGCGARGDLDGLSRKLDDIKEGRLQVKHLSVG